ncbi:MAG: hypothetical protein Q9222_006668, partial [Ikaeria aurantiellina]
MPSATTDLHSLASPNPKITDSNARARFQRLVQDIQSELGPKSSIISSDEIRYVLENLLKQYRSEDEGWQDFAFQDSSQTFTRNLVDAGNGEYNLVWILKGSLTETRYAWPSVSSTPSKMQITEETTFTRDQVTYMADSLGLHKISNPDANNYAVSLH